MKNIITVKYFKDNYGFSSVDSVGTKDEQIKFAIGRASTRIDAIVGGAVSKGLRKGVFTLNPDTQELKLNPNYFADKDPEIYAEAQDGLEALYEQTSALTKFAIDTG